MRSYSGSKEWRATEWIAGTIMRAACERSKGGGCRSPRKEGGRRLPFTAGLARIFASALEKASVAIESNEASRSRNGAMPDEDGLLCYILFFSSRGYRIKFQEWYCGME